MFSPTRRKLFLPFLIYNLIYLFLAVLGLRCCSGFSLVAASRGYTLVAAWGFLPAVASPCVEHGLQGEWVGLAAAPPGLWHAGSVALKHVGFSRTRNQVHVSCFGRQNSLPGNPRGVSAFLGVLFSINGPSWTCAFMAPCNLL